MRTPILSEVQVCQPMNSTPQIVSQGSVSADSLIPDVADPQSHNRCSYALSNPLQHTDRTGHWAHLAIGAAAMLAQAAARALRQACAVLNGAGG